MNERYLGLAVLKLEGQPAYFDPRDQQVMAIANVVSRKRKGRRISAKDIQIADAVLAELEDHWKLEPK